MGLPRAVGEIETCHGAMVSRKANLAERQFPFAAILDRNRPESLHKDKTDDL
ncbi:MAG: hypothetical protein HKP40_10450 [Litoreibacter sp.]|nr:hypothetical protein [Litoreibacter sp.]